MTIDITRDSFRRERHNHDVRWMQGRIQLDADLNELADIIAYIRETTGRDVIGESGGPIDNAGFKISPYLTSLKIGKGRYYIDGILVENDTEIPLSVQEGYSRFPDRFIDQSDTPAGTYLAYLDSWQHLVTSLDDQEIREVALPCPDTSARTRTVWQVKVKKIDTGEIIGKINESHPSFTIGPDIVYDNVASTNRSELHYNIDQNVVSPIEASINESSRSYAINEDVVYCDGALIKKIREEETSTGRLNARVSPVAVSKDPCTISSSGGYRRLENQLYRVEIHKGGKPGEATFKWSRENGSVIALWDTTDPNARLEKNADLLVNNPGGMAAEGFAPGNWVEITDEARELCRVPGYFARLSYTDGKKFTVDMVRDKDGNEISVPGNMFTNPKIRRWESCGAKSVEIPADSNEYIPLEDDGIEIQFKAEGKYQTGDYWLIPARTATKDIIWYPDESGSLDRLPDGPLHHFCMLAICRWSDSQFWKTTDCRQFFKPLVSEPAIHITEVGLLKRKDMPDSLQNDSIVTIDDFNEGLYLCFDRPVELSTLKPPTFSITLDLPVNLGFQQIILKGTINSSTDRKTISWKPNDTATLAKTTKKFAGEKFLTHIDLKGNFIWGIVDNKPAYLDGEAFGIDRGSGQISLSLPSGNFRKCSDFRMWFWLGTPQECKFSDIPQGGIVFIGEAGLDITATGAIARATISWYTGSETPGTTPSESRTIADPKAFYVAPNDFVGFTGKWYLGNTVAFIVKEPVLDIKIWDQNEQKDISARSVPAGHFLNFRVDSNLIARFMTIKVKTSDGTIYTQLLQDTNTPVLLTKRFVNAQPFFWVSAKDSNKGWATGLLDPQGNRIYPEGVYSVWIETNVNGIKDNYRDSFGNDFIGKTISSTKTITIIKDTVNIEANRDSVVPSTVARGVTIVADGGTSHTLGDEITLSGVNMQSDKVFLYVSGKNLSKERSELTALGTETVVGRSSTFNQVKVLEDHTWEYKWNTSKLKNLKPGTYTIHVVATPDVKENLESAHYGTISVTIRK